MTRDICCLLVEDDPEDQEFFVETLHGVSSTVGCYAVSNGEEALFALTQENITPDYIFTDLNMPKMDGFEFLKNLREIEKFKQTPVIIYTSDVSRENILRAKKLGAIAIYSKTRMSALTDILKRHFVEVDNNQTVL